MFSRRLRQAISLLPQVRLHVISPTSTFLSRTSNVCHSIRLRLQPYSCEMMDTRRLSSSSSRMTTTTPTRTSYQALPRNAITQQPSISQPTRTSYQYDTTTESRPRTGRRGTGRPATGTTTATRPRTGYSTLGIENQEIICAVSESRGIAPTVGLAFVNLDTGEAVLSQINDSQTYVRTTYKLAVFGPSKILIVESAAVPKSKLFSIIEDEANGIGGDLTLVDRRYWSESTGLEYIQHLAFPQDVESIKMAVSGNYYAVCSFAAVLKYTELGLLKSFPPHSLRIKYEPSEGSMMIDLATVKSLELLQNLHNAKSKHCLFGLLNETLTPMGARLLRSNILQPATDPNILHERYNAVEELSTKEDMFFSVRQALKPFLDVDRILTHLVLQPMDPGLRDMEQSINNVIVLKQFVSLVKPIFEALTGARSEVLQKIRSICASQNTESVMALINQTLNEDTTYARQPLDLKNQMTYAVKSGANGLLDVARQTYKESTADALDHVTGLADQHNLPLQVKFDNVRHFYIRLRAEELEERDLPAIFINVFRKKKMVDCQTLDLVKRNQKIADAHTEVLLMSDKAVKKLITDVREHMFGLFKICESIAMLDMLTSFAYVTSSQDYVRPTISETLAVRAGRHPIREKVHNTVKFIPNDIYATQQTRFQIITGCNMSGKSTYIGSVALMAIMAQIGSFVPAQNAAFPIIRQLFVRTSMDDSIEANVSTFAAEMRETSYILRNVDQSSLVIIDELGRGTSTRDGLAIALSIAEALVESRALTWFATHFRDLATILAERPGVVNLHLAVDMREDDKMQMLYQIAQGAVEEKHYGIKLAKVLPLPPDVIAHAELVSTTLEQQMQRKKRHSVGIVHARRRKLLLNLKEHLVQARDGQMNDSDLKLWLTDLQKEFVTRMAALDEEMRAITTQDWDGDEILFDDVANGIGANEIMATKEQAGAHDADELDQSSTGHSTFGGCSDPTITTPS